MAQSMSYSTAVISGANQTVQADEYLVVVPTADGDSISLLTPVTLGDNWIVEIANGDPTLSKDLYFEGGLPGQDPPQIFIAPPATRLKLAPAQAQRFAYTVGNGWAPLLPGSLV